MTAQAGIAAHFWKTYNYKSTEVLSGRNAAEGPHACICVLQKMRHSSAMLDIPKSKQPAALGCTFDRLQLMQLMHHQGALP